MWNNWEECLVHKDMPLDPNVPADFMKYKVKARARCSRACQLSRELLFARAGHPGQRQALVRAAHHTVDGQAAPAKSAGMQVLHFVAWRKVGMQVVYEAFMQKGIEAAYKVGLEALLCRPCSAPLACCSLLQSSHELAPQAAAWLRQRTGCVQRLAERRRRRCTPRCRTRRRATATRPGWTRQRKCSPPRRRLALPRAGAKTFGLRTALNKAALRLARQVLPQGMGA